MARVTNEQLAAQIELLRHDASLNGEREAIKEIARHLPEFKEVARLSPYVPDILKAVQSRRNRAIAFKYLWDHLKFPWRVAVFVGVPALGGFFSALFFFVLKH